MIVTVAGVHVSGPAWHLQEAEGEVGMVLARVCTCLSWVWSAVSPGMAEGLSSFLKSAVVSQ